MSNVFSLILSARVNSVESIGETYVMGITHTNPNVGSKSFNTKLFLNKNLSPFKVGDDILIVDAIPLNSEQTPDGWSYFQRLVATNQTKILPSVPGAFVNEVIIHGRLTENGKTGNGTNASGNAYKYSRMNIITNYWNSQAKEEQSFSLTGTYWFAELPFLLKGNSVIVKGQLESNESNTNGNTYFNLGINTFNYGARSLENSNAPKVKSK